MDFLTGLFVGSTFWFWILILLECGVLFACVESERGFKALFSVIITILILHYLFDFSVLKYFTTNPLMGLVWAGGYVAVGVIYALIRWDRKGAKWRRRYDEGNAGEKKDSLRYIPVASKSKNSIIVWMMYWPISAIWWLISDFVRELFATLYQKLAKTLDYITARHTSGINRNQD